MLTPAFLTVLAASSLVDVLPRLAEAWTRESGVRVALSFDASSRLAKQAEEGWGDVFISADAAWAAYLEGKDAVLGPRRLLAGNRLVAVVSSSSAVRIASAADLPEARHLALAGENVPAGRYATAALERFGVWDAVKGGVVRGDSARTALKWTASAEADAGIVYATDAAAEPRVRVAFEFPADSHPPIVYPGLVLRRSKRPKDAAGFLDYCAGPSARELWKAAGFLPPP
ncbi:MAG: molybdate ABC transporter substrate-binding protein [Elusimicrobia bacterium]|nr:molybdate ABC transporter substrate-binding protein [Elusimicrobiota bacterium]